MPVEEIARLVHEKSPKAFYHVDAIQAFGKYRIYPKKLGIDMLSVSSHKIHGPKGVGFLYINGKVRVQPQILGGGQQAGMRSGTDNVPGIAGLGVAAKMVYTDFEGKDQAYVPAEGAPCRGIFEASGCASQRHGALGRSTSDLKRQLYGRKK